MRVFHHAAALPPSSAACIGAFDGLHRGHQALLARARARAERLALVTFEPHPAEVLAPHAPRPRLQSPQQRERVCRALGIDSLVLLPFDAQIAKLEPAAFVRRFLLEGLTPSAVVVGEDFRYGRDRGGDVGSLGRQLRAAGIEFEAVAQVDDSAGNKLGSSAIRRELDAGRVEAAAEALGYLYACDGLVRHGAARGRDLGFRTANVESRNLVPARGVYSGWLCEHGEGASGSAWPAVANIGSNPTFADAARSTTGLEVHVLDLDLGDSLYDREVEFSFVSRLRDEIAFDGIDALVSAIRGDVARAREQLASAKPALRRPRAIRAAAGRSSGEETP